MEMLNLHRVMNPNQAKLEERDKRYKSLLEQREVMKHNHSETLSDMYDQGLYYFKQEYFGGDEKKFKDFEEEYRRTDFIESTKYYD